MRDTHRMKEKYDLSLDNRQIVSLMVAGIVVLGAVFVLGVVVGKKLAEGDGVAGAPDLLSALDEKAAAMEKVQNSPPTTFQDELTKKAPPPPRETEPAKPPAVAKPSAEPVAKPAEAKPAEAKPSAPAEDDPSEEMAAEEEPAEPAPAAKKDAPAEKGKAAAAPAPVPDDGKVPAADAVVTRTAEKDGARPTTSKAAQPVPAGKGSYTLQISAMQTREEAERFASGLKQRGYAPYIVAAQVPEKGTWYRVRLGSFPSRDAASRYLQDFRRETQMEAFVTSKE